MRVQVKINIILKIKLKENIENNESLTKRKYKN